MTYSGTKSKDKITDPSAAANLCRKAFAPIEEELELREHFLVIFLNRANNPIGYYHLATGGITSTVVDVRLAFSVALKCLATGMVLCHNHPSQNTKPSDNDILLTQKFKKAAEFLDINIVDHIILTKDSYHSMVSNGEF